MAQNNLELTIMGGKPDKEVLDDLMPFSSEEEMKKRVEDAFYGNLGALLNRYGSASGHGSDYHPDQQLTDALRGLPANHAVVREILKKAKHYLTEIPQLPVSILARICPGDKIPQDVPCIHAFNIGEICAPHDIFSEVQKAAYYIIEEHILTDTQPPEENLIMSEAADSMRGYAESMHHYLLHFANLLYREKAVLPAMLMLYTDLGNGRAIDAFVELYQVARGNDDFVLNGVKRGVSFKVIGEIMKKSLTKYGFPEERFLKSIDSVADEALKQGLREIWA